MLQDEQTNSSRICKIYEFLQKIWANKKIYLGRILPAALLAGIVCPSIFLFCYMKQSLQLSYFNQFLIYGSFMAIALSMIISFFLYREKIDKIPLLIKFTILCFAIFTGTVVLKSGQSQIKIPDLPGGSVGLRSYACEVVFTDIKIHFFNQDKKWVEIPQSVVYCPENWTFGVWPDDRKSLHSDSFSKFIEKTTTLNIDNQKITLESGIVLRSCGAVFCPDDKQYQLSVKDVRLDAHVIFITEKDSSLSPGCQLCLRVPVPKDSKDPKRENFQDLYLGFELPFHHPLWSKAWIPALDLQPCNTFRSPLREFIKHGGVNALRNGTKYKLSASVFGGYAKFNGYDLPNNWAVTLYEGEIERSE